MLMRVCSCFCLFIAILSPAGCQRNDAGLPDRPPAEIPVVMPGTPEDSARTVLLTLQARLRAAAAGDAETEKKAIAQLRYLAAEKQMLQGLRRMPQYKALLGDDLVAGFMDNWAATVAYYAEGYHFDRMRRSFESASRINENPTEVHIVAPASGANDEALIQVDCVYDEPTDRWLVARIGFVGEIEQPASTATPTAAAIQTAATQPAASQPVEPRSDTP